MVQGPIRWYPKVRNAIFNNMFSQYGITMLSWVKHLTCRLPPRELAIWATKKYWHLNVNIRRYMCHMELTILHYLGYVFRWKKGLSCPCGSLSFYSCQIPIWRLKAKSGCSKPLLLLLCQAFDMCDWNHSLSSPTGAFKAQAWFVCV